MSSTGSAHGGKSDTPRRKRTIRGWDMRSLKQAIRANKLPEDLRDRKAWAALQAAKEKASAPPPATVTFAKRQKAYPVHDSLLHLEPAYPASYVDEHGALGLGLEAPPPVCKAHGLATHEQYGALLQVWDFVRVFAGAAVLDGSPTACGDHMVLADSQVLQAEEAVPPASPKAEGIQSTGSALASPFVPHGLPSSAAHGEAAAESEADKLARINPWLVGVGDETVARLTTSLDRVEVEDLVTAFSCQQWRGHRLITRVHMALLRLILEQREGVSEDAADDDDDEDDFLFGDTAGDTEAVAPTLALLSPLTWPEVLRLVLLHTPEGAEMAEVADPQGVAAVKALASKEYTDLTLDQRLAILRLLVDGATVTKVVAGVVQDRVKRREAILDSQRAEERKAAETARAKREALDARTQRRREAVHKAAGEPGDPRPDQPDHAALAELRASLELELKDAAQAKDLDRLTDAIRTAKESGCGFELGRGKAKRTDPVLTAAALARVGLQEEAQKARLAEEIEDMKRRIALKYSRRLAKVATGATLLGRDRHGTRYWRFAADSTRVYVEWAVADSAATAAGVLLSEQETLARLAKQAGPQVSSGQSSASAAAPGAGAADDTPTTEQPAGKPKRRSKKFTAAEVDAELAGSHLADELLGARALAAGDPARTVSRWGFLDTIEGVQRLLNSLDSRGQQEGALYSALELAATRLSSSLWTQRAKREHIAHTMASRGMHQSSIEELLGLPEAGGDAGSAAADSEASALGGTKRLRSREDADAALARALAEEEREAAEQAPAPKRTRRSAALAASAKLAASARGAQPTTQDEAQAAAPVTGDADEEHPLDLLPTPKAASVAVRSTVLALMVAFKDVMEGAGAEAKCEWLTQPAPNMRGPGIDYMRKASPGQVPPPPPKVLEEHGTLVTRRGPSAAEQMSLDTWTAAVAAAHAAHEVAPLLLALESHMYAQQRAERRRAAMTALSLTRRAEAGEEGVDAPEEPWWEDPARPDGWSDGEEEGSMGSAEDEEEFAIDGAAVLWRYRSGRRRWRVRVAGAATLPAVALAVQELHERAAAGGLATVPRSLIAREARPWVQQEEDEVEEEEGLEYDDEEESE